MQRRGGGRLHFIQYEPDSCSKHRRPSLSSGTEFSSRLFTGKIFRQNATSYLTECARRYGDIVHYTAVGRHVYQINHPALIEDFFLKDAAKHHRGLVIKRSDCGSGQGLLTSEEPLHMRQRRLAQPAFHRGRIAGYADTIGQQALAMTARWKAAEADDGRASTLDLHEEMLAIAPADCG